MRKVYCKKPLLIEAVQWDGQNIDELKQFGGDKLEFYTNEAWPWVVGDADKIRLRIRTLESLFVCEIGDYIIRDIKGKFYSCKPDIFELSYTGPFQVSPEQTEQTESFQDDNFLRELSRVLNRAHAENASNTPDFILAEFVSDCINAFAKVVTARRKWWGQPDEWNSKK